MRTAGEVLRAARIKNGKSVAYVASLTKIRPRLIKNLEDNNWEKLPTLTVTLGLARNYAQALAVDADFVAALVRRDYKEEEKKIASDKSLIFLRKINWTPRTTFAALLILVGLILAGYLTRQYVIFVSPPPLLILTPVEGQIIKAGEFIVVGETRPEASVKVNNQQADIDENGKFKAEVGLFKGVQKITVESSSRSGKKTTVERKVFVE